MAKAPLAKKAAADAPAAKKAGVPPQPQALAEKKELDNRNTGILNWLKDNIKKAETGGEWEADLRFALQKWQEIGKANKAARDDFAAMFFENRNAKDPKSMKWARSFQVTKTKVEENVMSKVADYVTRTVALLAHSLGV